MYGEETIRKALDKLKLAEASVRSPCPDMLAEIARWESVMAAGGALTPHDVAFILINGFDLES